MVIAQLKNPSAMQETLVLFLVWEDPLEKEMATHSSILAWRIPWREEPSRLYSPCGHKESDTTKQLSLRSPVNADDSVLSVSHHLIGISFPALPIKHKHSIITYMGRVRYSYCHNEHCLPFIDSLSLLWNTPKYKRRFYSVVVFFWEFLKKWNLNVCG